MAHAINSISVVRYLSYPVLMVFAGTVFLFGIGNGVPYFPTVPITVGTCLLVVALLERVLPFHAEWLQDHGDTVTDAMHAVVNLAVLMAVHTFVGFLPWRFQV